MNRSLLKRSNVRIAAAVTASAIALAACGGAVTSSGSAPAAGSGSKPAAAAGSGRVLPVTTNPISNNATAKTLTIAKVLVENNVDASGKAVDDHLGR